MRVCAHEIAHPAMSVCTCVCMHACACVHAPAALFPCFTSPFYMQHVCRYPLDPSYRHVLLSPWKCSYLYVEIGSCVQPLLSDLQNHPANAAWTASPARWPFSNTLALQTGVLLLIPAPAPRQACETAHSVCALGRQPRRRRRREEERQAGMGRDGASAGWWLRGFGVCN